MTAQNTLGLNNQGSSVQLVLYNVSWYFYPTTTTLHFHKAHAQVYNIKELYSHANIFKTLLWETIGWISSRVSKSNQINSQAVKKGATIKR